MYFTILNHASAGANARLRVRKCISFEGEGANGGVAAVVMVDGRSGWLYN